jgi:hypothetical protein
VRDRLADLGEGTDVVLITFTDPANLADYRATNEVPFPILLDPRRVAYRAYGLDRGSVTRVWGWRALRRYVQILRPAGRAGLRMLHRPVEDTLQLGGDFIVAPDGILVWGHWGSGPDDRPDPVDLIAAARRDVAT